MNRPYRLTRLAERDVREIVLYIADRFGVERAERARLEFLNAFRLLAQRPELGRHRPELWPEPFRFWRLGPALIAYPGPRGFDPDRARGSCIPRMAHPSPELARDSRGERRVGTGAEQFGRDRERRGITALRSTVHVVTAQRDHEAPAVHFAPARIVLFA